jgi:hypothetical protein
MNDRIRLLAEQCWINDGGPDSYFSQEKFAELIVRECSQYIEDKFDFCGDELIIAEKLLEHFGVE